MATSKLQRQTTREVENHFGRFEIFVNHRPDWLEGLELDIFISTISTAIEVQGRQHCEFIEFFHGTYRGFELLQQRDIRKKELCDISGIDLFYVFDNVGIATTIREIYRRHDFNQTTIGSGWMSDDKIPSMSARNDKSFRKRIMKLGNLHMNGSVTEAALEAKRLSSYANKHNLVLTKGFKKIIDRVLA